MIFVLYVFVFFFCGHVGSVRPISRDYRNLQLDFAVYITHTHHQSCFGQNNLIIIVLMFEMYNMCIIYIIIIY